MLIEVAAAGVNDTDLNARIGWYSKTVTVGTGEGLAIDDAGWSARRWNVRGSRAPTSAAGSSRWEPGAQADRRAGARAEIGLRGTGASGRRRARGGAARRAARGARRRARLRRATFLAEGADETVDRGTDLVTALGRGSVDVVLALVGGAQFSQLLDVLRRGGRDAGAGAIGGPMAQIGLRTVDLNDLPLSGCTFQDDAGVFENLVPTASDRLGPCPGPPG